jgi:two-component system sensor histidine kinase BaeS
MKRLPTLRLQLAGLVLAAVCLPLVVVLSSGWVMLGMHDEVKIVAVAVVSAIAGLAAALLLARRILRPLEHLRVASARLACGDLSARASESEGPRELLEVSVAFNEMAGDIERLFDARRQLVAWASHDLRTPVASLGAMLEAIEDGLAEPDEYLPAIREQLRILTSLVDDLFELALIDAGAATMELRNASLEDLVTRALAAMRAEAERRNVRLARTNGGAGLSVRMAPEKIERVLLNLLGNAVRHTASGGTVSVLTEPEPERVVVAVEDMGNGLSHLTRRRMFERFWRDDESRTRSTGGAGLGLAIAEGLVRAHGGTIWAENRSAGGARVAFSLPRTPAR